MTSKTGGLPLRGPHRDTIAGLIAAAAWLSQHPELPETSATVYLGDIGLTREQMQTVAVAMDKDLKDVRELPFESMLTLRAEINGSVGVYATARLKDLGGHVSYEYESVLPVCPRCKGEGKVGSEDCEWCGSKGYLPPELYPVSHQDFVGPVAGVVGEAA